MGNRVREQIQSIRDTASNLLTMMQEHGSFIPQAAVDLVAIAQTAGSRADNVRKTVRKVLFPSLSVPCKGSHDQQLQIEVLSILTISATLVRYILGSGGPVDREILRSALTLVAEELSKKNMCRDGYPQDSTMENAFGALALITYHLFDKIRHSQRGCC